MKRFYLENKREILIYLSICMIFSMLAFGSGRLTFAMEEFTAPEVVATLGGNFGVLTAPVMQNFLGGIDTPTALLVMGGVSLIFDVIPDDTLIDFGHRLGIVNLSNYSFGILDYNWFRLLIVVWFVISKLSRSNRVSYTTGVILENYEGKIGRWVTLIVAATQLLANVSVQNVQAAEISSPVKVATINGFNALLCFLLLVMMLVVYSVVRLFFFSLDITACITCSIVPFAGLLMEFFKGLSVVVLTVLALFQPLIFWFIFTCVVLLSIFLCRRSYISLCYFKGIYVKPFFKGIKGFEENIPLLHPKVPFGVGQFAYRNEATIVLPVYLMNKLHSKTPSVRHQQWWFVSNRDKHFLCKPQKFGKTCTFVELKNFREQKLFVKSSLRFIEFFNIYGNEDVLEKALPKLRKREYFVMSKEYSLRFQEIVQFSGLVNYDAYRNELRRQKSVDKSVTPAKA